MPMPTTTSSAPARMPHCCARHIAAHAEHLSDLADMTLLLREHVQRQAGCEHEHDVRALSTIARCLSEAALRAEMLARGARRQRCEP